MIVFVKVCFVVKDFKTMVQTITITSQGESGMFINDKSKSKGSSGCEIERTREPKFVSAESKELQRLTRLGCQNIHTIPKGLPLARLPPQKNVKKFLHSSNECDTPESELLDKSNNQINLLDEIDAINSTDSGTIDNISSWPNSLSTNSMSSSSFSYYSLATNFDTSEDIERFSMNTFGINKLMRAAHNGDLDEVEEIVERELEINKNRVIESLMMDKLRVLLQKQLQLQEGVEKMTRDFKNFKPSAYLWL